MGDNGLTALHVDTVGKTVANGARVDHKLAFELWTRGDLYTIILACGIDARNHRGRSLSHCTACIFDDAVVEESLGIGSLVVEHDASPQVPAVGYILVVALGGRD